MDQDVMAIAYSPDGKSVVSSGFETGIYWWNPQNGERVKLQGGHGVAVHELAFSKDGKRLVSAAADRTVKIWDGVSGTVLRSLSVGSVTYACAISSDNKLVVSGSFDGLVRVWDEATGRQLATLVALPKDGDWLALTPEGYFAAGDSFSSLARWRASAKDDPSVAAALRQTDLVSRALRGETIPPAKVAPKK
jgi:WD40 repeat protein